MSNGNWKNVQQNVLTTANILEFSQAHPVFNAGFIYDVSIDPNMTIGALPGDAFVWNGYEFTLMTVRVNHRVASE